MVYSMNTYSTTMEEPFAVPLNPSEKKRKSLHLSLNQQQAPTRKRLAVLTSPDLKDVSSPTLNKYFVRNSGNAEMQTPLLTPSTFEILFNKSTPTEEQKQFADGFLEALENVGKNKDPLLTDAGQVQQNVLFIEGLGQIYQDGDDVKLITASASNDTVQYIDSDTQRSVSLPVFREEEFKSFTDISHSQPHVDSTYMSLPTDMHSYAAPAPILAKRTASIKLTSGGKVVNVCLEADSDPYDTEVSENIPTTINSPVSSFCEEQDDIMDSDDDDYKPSTPKRGGRKGNTRPIPANLPAAERRKLEKKRERNRVAASKCRQKKVQLIDEQHKTIRQLKSDKSELRAENALLKKQVAQFKAFVTQHFNGRGCQPTASELKMLKV